MHRIDQQIADTAVAQVKAMFQEHMGEIDQAYSLAEGKLPVGFKCIFEPKNGGLSVKTKISFVGEKIEDSTSTVVFPGQLPLEFPLKDPAPVNPDASGCRLWCPIQGHPWACDDERYKAVCPLKQVPHRQATVFSPEELAEIEAMKEWCYGIDQGEGESETAPDTPDPLDDLPDEMADVTAQTDPNAGKYLWCAKGKREKRVSLSVCLSTCPGVAQRACPAFIAWMEKTGGPTAPAADPDASLPDDSEI